MATWYRIKADNGELYYHNEETNETVWTAPLDVTIIDFDDILDQSEQINPRSNQSGKSIQSVEGIEELPEHWIKFTTDEGEDLTEETSWVRPCCILQKKEVDNTVQRTDDHVNIECQPTAEVNQPEQQKNEQHAAEEEVVGVVRLPNNWLRFTSDEGDYYYHNEITEETVWELREDLINDQGSIHNKEQRDDNNSIKIENNEATVDESKNDASNINKNGNNEASNASNNNNKQVTSNSEANNIDDDDVGCDWLRFSTDEGEEYFYHQITEETVWDMPEEYRIAHKLPAVVVANNDNSSTNTVSVTEPKGLLKDHENIVEITSQTKNSTNITDTASSSSSSPMKPSRSHNSSNNNNSNNLKSSNNNENLPVATLVHSNLIASSTTPIANVNDGTSNNNGNNARLTTTTNRQSPITNNNINNNSNNNTNRSSPAISPSNPFDDDDSNSNKNANAVNNNKGTISQSKPSTLQQSKLKSSNPFDDDVVSGNSNSNSNNGKNVNATYVGYAKPPVTRGISNSNSSGNINGNNITTNTTRKFANPFGDDDENTVSSSNSNAGTIAQPPLLQQQQHQHQQPPPPRPKYKSSLLNSGAELLLNKNSNNSNGVINNNNNNNKATISTSGNIPRPPPVPVAPPRGHNNNNNVNNNNTNRYGTNNNNNSTSPAVAAFATPTNKNITRPSQYLANHYHDQIDMNRVNSNENLKKLLRYGVKPTMATTALQEHSNDWLEALKHVNNTLFNAVQADPYATNTSIWAPRLSCSIRSWLPNILEKEKPDYHTGYVVVVNYTDLDNQTKVWQLIIRYTKFKELNNKILKYARLARIHAEFPDATVGQWFFGISDEIRNERMNKFGTWLRELLVNPILMTTYDIIRALVELLEIEKNGIIM